MSHFSEGLVCAFCEVEIGPQDHDSMIDSAGVYCGACCHRMGIAGDLILKCGLCDFPILGKVYSVSGQNHDCEYCETCYDILWRAGILVHSSLM